MSKIPCHARTAACTAALLLIGPGLSACGGGSSETASTAAKTPSTQAAGSPARRTGSQTKGATTPRTPGKLGSIAPTKPSKLTPSNKGVGRALTSKGFAQTLSRFTACLRREGVKIPTANAPGKAPLISTKGVDTHSRSFLAATNKCRQELLATLRRQQSKPAKR